MSRTLPSMWIYPLQSDESCVSGGFEGLAVFQFSPLMRDECYPLDWGAARDIQFHLEMTLFQNLVIFAFLD